MDTNKIEILARCQVVPEPQSSHKAMAAMREPQSQVDLMFMKSLLVSTGENLNDDVFLPDEMWKARYTPVLKPVDWEHNTGRELTEAEQKENPGKVVVDNQTIGVMYNSYAIDADGLTIDDEKAQASDFEVPEHFDIIDEAVIWKGLYPQTAARIEEGAARDELFVSMEAWFADYDYLVGEKVVARNEETAFLDDSLRAYGGNGTFGNSRVRRVLRDLTFGGKGIVQRPANEPSVIQKVAHEPMCASASANEVIINNVIGDIRNTKASKPREVLDTMSDAKKTEQATASVPLDLYTKASDEIAVLKTQAKAKDDEVESLKASVVEKDEQLENVKSAFTKGCQALAEALPELGVKISSANSENFFSVLAEALKEDKVKAEELQNKLKDALAKVAKIEADAKTAARKARVDALDIEDEHKEKILSSVESLDDEAFNTLLETLAQFPPKKDEKKGEKKEDEEDMDKEKGKKKSCSSEMDELNAILENVQASEQAPPAGEEVPQGVDLGQAFAGLVGEMLTAHKPASKE